MRKLTKFLTFLIGVPLFLGAAFFNGGDVRETKGDSSVTVTKTASEFATLNNWSTSSSSKGGKIYKYSNGKLDDIISLSFVGISNTASYWGSDIRLYGTKNKSDASISVSAANNYIIESITFTFTVSNVSSFALNTGVAKTINSSSASFTMTSDTSNGQLRFTKFSVTYKSNVVYASGVSISSSDFSIENKTVKVDLNSSGAGNDSGTLSTTITPSNATTKTVTWSSSDDDNCAVDAGYVVLNTTIVGSYTVTASADGAETKGAVTDSVTFNVVDPSAATLKSISVSGTPTKPTQYVGNVFDPSGLTFTGIYSDESQVVIEDTNNIVWNTLVANQSPTGTYKGVTITVTSVTVLPNTLSITFTGSLGKTTYKNIDAAWDQGTLAASGTYADGTAYTGSFEYTFNPATPKAMGTSGTLTVTAKASTEETGSTNIAITIEIQHGTTPTDPFTITEYKAYAAANGIDSNNECLPDKYYVVGKLVHDNNYKYYSSSGSLTFYISDGTNKLKAYSLLSADETQFTNDPNFKDGTNVLCGGAIVYYNELEVGKATNAPTVGTSVEAKATIYNVSINEPSTTNVALGDTLSLTAVVESGYEASETLSWSSSNVSILTVSSTGVVTPVAMGTATVTAESTFDSSKKDTIDITVVAAKVHVESVSLNKSTISALQLGTSETLTATVLPANATDTSVSWSSSNESVATVDDGEITPVATGTTTITVTTTDGAKTATCNVTVVYHAVTSVVISSEKSSVELNKTVSFSLTVNDEEYVDPSATIVWSCSNDNATIVGNGKTATLTGAKMGSVNVSATFNGVASNVVSFNVTGPRPSVCSLIASYDFSTITEKTQTKLTNDSALELFNACYTGSRDDPLSSTIADTVYRGNGSGGEFENDNKLLKFSTGSVDGSLELTYSSDIKINTIKLLAHSWTKNSATTFDVNDIGEQDASISGSHEWLIFNLSSATNVITISNADRGTIKQIELYYDISASEDVQAVFAFQDGYMHPEIASTVTSDTGACRGETGYFALAKTAFNALTDNQRLIFSTNTAFAGFYARYVAWAKANGEVVSVSSSGSVSYAALGSEVLLSITSSTATSIIVVCSIVSLASLGFFFALRKRKVR